MTSRGPEFALFGVCVGYLLFAAGGCSSSAGPSATQACQPPTIEGTMFTGSGTAVLRGTGTLPDGVPNGLQLELLVQQGAGAFGVLPDNLFAPDAVCGKTVHYVV